MAAAGRRAAAGLTAAQQAQQAGAAQLIEKVAFGHVLLEAEMRSLRARPPPRSAAPGAAPTSPRRPAAATAAAASPAAASRRTYRKPPPPPPISWVPLDASGPAHRAHASLLTLGAGRFRQAVLFGGEDAAAQPTAEAWALPIERILAAAADGDGGGGGGGERGGEVAVSSVRELGEGGGGVQLKPIDPSAVDPSALSWERLRPSGEAPAARSFGFVTQARAQLAARRARELSNYARWIDGVPSCTVITRAGSMECHRAQ